ncbi:hypothetical protein [Frankia sp. QA3]|uniref:hypothetical protein n=1 Tax=Frankia sp. QA3 TaxID=710111 RepID=UPI0003125BF2|nr:hypothetical protein [Frankia sp. QA3]
MIRDGEVVEQTDEGERDGESEGTRDTNAAAKSGRGDAEPRAGAGSSEPADEDTSDEHEQPSDAEGRPRASVGG